MEAKMKLIDKIFRYVKDEFGVLGSAFELDPFTYVINYLPATANTTTTNQFIVQADSAFVWCKGTAIVTATDNVTFLTVGQWPFLITVSDSGSGRDLMDSGVHLYNMFGTAERPFILSKPKIFDPNSTVSGKLQSLHTATNYNVRLAFHGFKVFGSITAYKRHKATK